MFLHLNKLTTKKDTENPTDKGQGIHEKINFFSVFANMLIFFSLDWKNPAFNSPLTQYWAGWSKPEGGWNIQEWTTGKLPFYNKFLGVKKI